MGLISVSHIIILKGDIKMCIVPIFTTEDNFKFILYNIVFIKKETFTKKEIVDIMKQYNYNNHENKISKIIQKWLNDGLIKNTINGYSVC